VDKPQIKLKQWQLQKSMSGNFALFGVPIDHPTMGSGVEIKTSRLLRIDFEKGIAETLNTIYLLEGVGEQAKS